MSIFYGHLSDDDREILALENSFDLNVRKIGAAIEAVCEATAINMKEAENKVIMESGTDDDLEMLFEAAVGEGAEKSKSLIGKLFEAIKNFITNVKNKIKSIFTSEKAEALKEEKSVSDTGVLDTVNGKLTALMNEGKAKIAKIVHGGNVGDDELTEFKTKAKKIGIITAAGTAATVAGTVLYNKILKGSKEIDGAENATDAMMKLADAGEKYENMNSIKGIAAACSEAIKNSSSALFKAISESKAVTSAKGAAEKVKGKFGKKDGTEKVEESGNDFDALLENYSYETEEGADGTKSGSLEDLEKALAIF